MKVIALGNSLRGDDGIGPAVVKLLQAHNTDGTLEIIESSGDAFDILEHLIDTKPIIIIDCAQMGRKPGEVVKFKVNDANIKIFEKNISLHGFSFAEMYKIAQEMGEVPDCTIIGIEPQILDFNRGLSEIVRNKIPEIIEMVVEETKNYV